MKYFKLLALVSLVSFVGGCVSFEPIPDEYEGPTVWLYDTKTDVSGTKVHFFELHSIDGRSVETSSYRTRARNSGRGLEMESTTVGRSVPIGKVSLKLSGNTHVAAPILALGGNMFSVEGVVEVNLKESTRYRVVGSLSKEYQVVWLETEDGEIVSNKIEKGTPPNDA